MLSVAAPGCAGMERLGAPAGPRLRHDPRHAHPLTSRACDEQLVGEMVERLLERQARARSLAAAESLGLPPRIPLPDGEHGRDAHLQIRVAYQQAELTRCSIRPPPNKSVSDVPEWAEETETPRRVGVSKKDGFMQKAVRYLVRKAIPPGGAAAGTGAGGGGGAGLGGAGAGFPGAPVEAVAAPCVMVPRRPPAHAHRPPRA